jgi:hypothetical protein
MIWAKRTVDTLFSSSVEMKRSLLSGYTVVLRPIGNVMSAVSVILKSAVVPTSAYRRR